MTVDRIGHPPDKCPQWHIAVLINIKLGLDSAMAKKSVGGKRMRAEDYPAIRRLDLFAGMDEARFDNLLRLSFLQTFPPQLEIIRAGDSADFLFVLVEGAVELFASSNGRETSLMLIAPVSSFILAAVFNDAAYLTSARTLSKSQLLMIPAEAVRAAIGEDSALADAAMRELAVAYRSLVRLLKEMKLRPGVERLANFILRESRKRGTPDKIVLPTNKRTIAALLGMTPENLSRALGSLAAHGLRVSGPTIRIENRAALERFARPDPLIDEFDD